MHGVHAINLVDTYLLHNEILYYATSRKNFQPHASAAVMYNINIERQDVYIMKIKDKITIPSFFFIKPVLKARDRYVTFGIT